MSGELAERGHAATVTRARLAYSLVVIVIIMTGLAIRYPGLGLSWWLAKYGGSLLLGAMGYFIMASAAPEMAAHKRAGVASFIAALVELSRLYHAPGLDEFRLTTAGALLLGRVFSIWDILAYWTGIGGGVVADAVWRGRSSGTTACPR